MRGDAETVGALGRTRSDGRFIDLAQRERESGRVVDDEHAVLARLRLGHEAEVVHIEASRARLI